MAVTSNHFTIISEYVLAKKHDRSAISKYGDSQKRHTKKQEIDSVEVILPNIYVSEFIIYTPPGIVLC